MFGWLRRAFDAGVGVIDDVIRAWVSGIINGVYGYLHSIFGLARDGFDILAHAAYLSWHALVLFMDDTVALFYQVLRVVIPAVITALKHGLAVITKYAEGVYHYVVKELALLRTAISVGLNALKNWVLTHVWRPLDNLVTSALKWITSRGETLWFYITHPDKLVDLLWDHLIAKIEHEAWAVSEKLGTFALSLVVRNLKRFAVLVEDIIDAIF